MTEQPLDKLMDLLATDGTASDVSDEIKNILFTRSAEKIDAMRPEVSYHYVRSTSGTRGGN